MKLRLALALALGGSMLLTVAGCCDGWWRRRHQEPAPGALPANPNMPPPGYQTVPPRGAEIITPGSTAPPLPPTSSGYAPNSQSGAYWIPAPQPQLPANPVNTTEPPLAQARPMPRVSERPPEPVRLLPPDLAEPTLANPTPPPPVPGLSGLPAGIPAFAEVKDKVSTGLKPDLEGLDWLQAKGYRTVLHLRRPGLSDAAAKEQVEKRGLKFLSLEVTPEKLNEALVADFNRIVADEANQPLFVYDSAGLRSGVMWYMNFRTVEKMSDDRARDRALQFGLRTTGSDEVAAFWIAIQKYFEAKK
ncbi:MAG TPA: hypothetical protein VGZ47_22635 [Gemmataceae bacterium]|nr:hypothetical protein [Gemmataceae bacterium]